VEAAKWLAAKQVALIGADTMGVEVGPNPDAELAFPVHRELITKNGILPSGKSRFVRARRRSNLGVPICLRPCADQRRHWLAGKSDRHPMTTDCRIEMLTTGTDVKSAGKVFPYDVT
jgi:hypothetical protein